MQRERERSGNATSIALLAYGAASLLHFSHTAEHVHAYPNLSPSWTRAGVYAAWLGVTAIGGLGHLATLARRITYASARRTPAAFR